MFWMVLRDQVWGVWCAKSAHFWNIPREGLTYHTASTSLFISLSWECTFLVMLIWDLPGPCHQYPKSSTVVISLYHWLHFQLLTVAFFHAQAKVIMSTQFCCLYLLEFTQCVNCHELFKINIELCLPAQIFFLLASPVFTFFSPPMWALVIC